MTNQRFADLIDDPQVRRQRRHWVLENHGELRPAHGIQRLAVVAQQFGITESR